MKMKIKSLLIVGASVVTSVIVSGTSTYFLADKSKSDVAKPAEIIYVTVTPSPTPEPTATPTPTPTLVPTTQPVLRKK